MVVKHFIPPPKNHDCHPKTFRVELAVFDVERSLGDEFVPRQISHPWFAFKYLSFARIKKWWRNPRVSEVMSHLFFCYKNVQLVVLFGHLNNLKMHFEILLRF